MVGIVIVSHSRRLAEGIVELVTQMTQGKCNIAIAGGIDDEQYPIGTDSIRVMSAIEEVHDESGVLVLMDLGSALLSTEVAIELLPPEVAGTVQLCSAPIVEGAMAAAVAAAANLPIDIVKAEAMGALAGKQSHLGRNLTLCPLLRQYLPWMMLKCYQRHGWCKTRMVFMLGRAH